MGLYTNESVATVSSLSRPRRFLDVLSALLLIFIWGWMGAWWLGGADVREWFSEHLPRLWPWLEGKGGIVLGICCMILGFPPIALQQLPSWMPFLLWSPTLILLGLTLAKL